MCFCEHICVCLTAQRKTDIVPIERNFSDDVCIRRAFGRCPRNSRAQWKTLLLKRSSISPIQQNERTFHFWAFCTEISWFGQVSETTKWPISGYGAFSIFLRKFWKIFQNFRSFSSSPSTRLRIYILIFHVVATFSDYRVLDEFPKRLKQPGHQFIPSHWPETHHVCCRKGTRNSRPKSGSTPAAEHPRDAVFFEQSGEPRRCGNRSYAALLSRYANVSFSFGEHVFHEPFRPRRSSKNFHVLRGATRSRVPFKNPSFEFDPFLLKNALCPK